MDSFAFIIHPINPKQDVKRKFPFLGKILNEPLINFFSLFFPPIYLSEIQNITSESTGKTIKGWFIACPLTAKRMVELPEWIVYHKIVQTGRMAQRLGADILGLGAFTSVVGDGGITVANRLDIPVTTGNSYTIATAIQALRKAAKLMNIDIGKATAAVVGATGSIGQVCAELLAEEVSQLILIGRNESNLQDLYSKMNDGASAQLSISTDLNTLQKADLIITVTSALHAIVHPEHIRAGSVICDVSRPRDVSKAIASSRDDVLVIDGGVIDVPGPVEFNFDFGFPAGEAYACMAETFALTLEERFESYSLGKQIDIHKVKEIAAIAEKHGFRLSGFRSFERPISEEQIKNIRKNANRD
ncbi:MAG: shikimate dehydrogenase [Anaerolineaceae bacterium 4572_5.2]|nr:MAG: shikimate dehydrogenase [Anaerolineaceae bacterium 4572_5.2]